MEGDDLLTTADVELLNQSVIERAASLCRVMGLAIAIAGAVGVLAWGWTAVRSQQQLDSPASRIGIGGETVDLVDRLDVFAAGTALLLLAVLAIGLGLGVRLTADYAVNRTGGSMSELQEGDELPPTQIELGDSES